jgi:predicted nucleotide-binding protein (sugar kinase/HSP70/actin superfamily)
LLSWLVAGVEERVYGNAYRIIFDEYRRFRFHEPSHGVHALKTRLYGLVDQTYITGEGWLIPAMVAELAEHGVEDFLIIQPFACLSNHITGRGLAKPLKSLYPDIRIQCPDYDADISPANVENRLQMMIMNRLRERERRHA